MDTGKKHHYKLFIAGMNPESFRAIENVREIFDSHLNNQFNLEVIDIYQQRQLLTDMNIIAVPTLVRVAPEPEVRLIGDMQDKKEIMKVFDIVRIKKSNY